MDLGLQPLANSYIEKKKLHYKEKKFRLEQLRALENNIDIDVVLAKTSPIGVDNWLDYQKVKNLLEVKINRI